MRSRLPMFAATLVLAGVAGPAGGQEVPASTFQAFEGRTDSYAAGVSTKQLAALPLPVEAFLTRTRTEVNSQPRAQAYAGVVDVPLGELLGIFGFPTQLPSYCYADYPGEMDATCGVTGAPVELPPGAPSPRVGQGRTHVEGDGFNLDATAAESSVGAGSLTSEQVTVGASTSRSASRIAEGVLENVTEVVLQQVDIGGAVAFEEMRATARAVTDGQPGGAEADAALTVSGVSVMGERVPVPGELDLATLARDVLGPLEELLSAQGVTLKVLEAPTSEASPDGRTAKASVAGLRVESSEPATGNRVGVTLAVAHASAVAVPAGDRGVVTNEPESVLPDVPPADDVLPAPESPAPPPNAPVLPSAQPFPGTAASTAGGDPREATFDGGSYTLPAVGSPDPSGAPVPDDPAPPESAAPAPVTLSPALASEVLGARVADRLPLLYAAGAAGILSLGLLGFRLAHRARP